MESEYVRKPRTLRKQSLRTRKPAPVWTGDAGFLRKPNRESAFPRKVCFTDQPKAT